MVLFACPVLAAQPEACASCHPQQTTRYRNSPMGRSIGAPEAIHGGLARHARSGSTVTVEQRNGKMFHRLSERGLTADYEIAYQIGAGKFARTYLVRLGDYLFESPATWFRAYGWDVSP